MGQIRKRFYRILLKNASDFCKEATVHGLSHLGEPKKSNSERLFWGMTVTIAIALATNSIYKSYIRYENNPVVMAINKNQFEWDIPFPGTTWCFKKKTDEEKAARFIMRKWNITSGEKFNFYMDFLKTLSDTQFSNLTNLARFAIHTSLKNLDLQAVANEINFEFNEYNTVTYTANEIRYQSIFTEEGICFSTTFLAPYLSLNASFQSEAKREPEVCRYFQLPCFARILGIPRQLKYYIHSPYEIPDSRSKSWDVLDTLATDTYFTFLSIEAHPSLKDLRQQQRKCSLREEAFPGSESPFYSFKLCQMNCRRELCMKYCKCVPHFYMKRAGQPVCDLKGLVCLSKYSSRIIALDLDDGSETGPKPRTDHKCECYPSCSETEYILQKTFYVMQREILLSGMRYSWYIDNYPRIAVTRRVIFSFEGLLVSLGGIASFFIGSSIMSAIEVFYFFPMRLFRIAVKEFTNKKEQSTLNKKRVHFNFQREQIIQFSGRKGTTFLQQFLSVGKSHFLQCNDKLFL